MQRLIAIGAGAQLRAKSVEHGLEATELDGNDPPGAPAEIGRAKVVAFASDKLVFADLNPVEVDRARRGSAHTLRGPA